MLREFLAADIERIEGIRAVGAVFQQVLLGLRLLLHRLVLAEAVSSSFYASRLDSENEVIVILTVEERHEPLLPGKALVDEQVFLVVPHGISEVHVLHLPSMPFKLVDDHVAEVLVIHGVVAA